MQLRTDGGERGGCQPQRGTVQPDRQDRQADTRKDSRSKLDELLPVAFAIVKETARRFKENEVLEVTARDWDRDLAAITALNNRGGRQSLLEEPLDGRRERDRMGYGSL
ncbi:MAG: hypothetical protein MZV63_23140 [Marinilabiliales bacterium]|nr:hypothetical protein [Marinilabiliales bacterium]